MPGNRNSNNISCSSSSIVCKVITFRVKLLQINIFGRDFMRSYPASLAWGGLDPESLPEVHFQPHGYLFLATKVLPLIMIIFMMNNINMKIAIQTRRTFSEQNLKISEETFNCKLSVVARMSLTSTQLRLTLLVVKMWDCHKTGEEVFAIDQ